jgi:hypothetical protein
MSEHFWAFVFLGNIGALSRKKVLLYFHIHKEKLAIAWILIFFKKVKGSLFPKRFLLLN